MKKIMSLCAVFILLFGQAASAATIVNSLPYNLTNGTLADATQVMANFNQIVNNANANAAHNGANSDITSLTGLTTPLAPAYGGTPVFVGGTSAGSANVQTLVSPVPSNFSLSAGSIVSFIAGYTNTGATTINVNTTGATAIRKLSPNGLTPLVGNELIANQAYLLLYDGTYFELISATPQQRVLNVTDFGGDPTDTSDSTTALQSWWTAVQAAPAGTWAHINGKFKATSALTWDYSTRRAAGVTVYGDGMQQSGIYSTITSGNCLTLEVVTGANSYYNSWMDFQVQCATSGAVMAIGRLNGTDTFQSNYLRNLSILNEETGNANSVALQVNGLLTGVADNVQTGNNPATSGATGSGDSLQLTAMALMTWNGASPSNATNCIHITGNGTAVFPVYGNTFNTPDVENCEFAILNDSNQMYANTFNNGTMYTIYASGGYLVKSTTAGKTTAGAAIVLHDVTINNNALYGTPSVRPAQDPSNHVGVIFTGGSYGTVSTPSFPASTTTYTNTTGQVQDISWWGSGSISALSINGLSVGTTLTHISLVPDGTIAFAYTGSLSWYFINAAN